MRETSKEKSNGSKRTGGSVDHRSQQNRNLKYGLRSLYRFEGSKDSSPHLENCTGRDKTKTANNLFQLVLGDRMFALELARSSEQERRVDARALIAEEGRDKLRKASGSRK